MRMAVIYARVSSEQQREENTIASQTASLIEFARNHELEVPKEWVFEDEGYSGATLERPGLERVRDLAAEGQIQVVLAYSPDRLSRKYAYQILLIEEFARHGVETLFVKSPQGNSPEDHLLVQFQGMIAEYERAQILERSRRGKRHRAQAGEVSVMSGAPYGYRYIRKTDEALAAYLVEETEASVVRRVYHMYTVDGLSIAEITRRLNREGIPPRRAGRWERSVIWSILRNPAYCGVACFGKTRLSARAQMRPQRRRGVTTPSNTGGHQRPREEWIEIPVPALVTEETFARTQELLYQNKIRSRRRTIAPSIVQGLVGCAKCGYAFSRTSTQTSARKIHYYKCIGSDSWRKLGGPVCDNKQFIRQELLDQIVWDEVLRLLQDPVLIQQELDRRLAAARTSDPTRKREQTLQRELSHVDKGIERLLTAYQEELLSLEQLRERMPMLRQRQQTLRAELQAITDQANDRAAFLRLAETLTAFLTRLRSAAETLSVIERQKIVRLLVKEILVGEDAITIRHSIPIPTAPTQNGGSEAPGGQNYLLCKGSARRTLRRSFSMSMAGSRRIAIAVILDRRFEKPLDQRQYLSVADPARHALDQFGMRDRIEVAAQICVDYLTITLIQQTVDRSDRILCASFRSISVLLGFEVRLEDRFDHQHHSHLDNTVLDGRNTQRSLTSVRLLDPYPSDSFRPIALLP